MEWVHFKQIIAQPRLRNGDDFFGGCKLMAQHPIALRVRDRDDFVDKAVSELEHEPKPTFRGDFACLKPLRICVFYENDPGEPAA